MKSLAIISHSANLNGAERCLIETVKVIQQSKAFNRIVVYLPCEGKLRCYIEPYAEVRIASLPWWISFRKFNFKEKIKLTKQLFKVALSLKKEFIQEKYSLVITNTIATPVGAWAAKFANISHQWFIHELGRLDHGYGYGYGYRVSYKLMECCSDSFIVNSKYVCEFYRKYFRKPITVVYQPVDMKKNIHCKKTIGDTLRLIIVGRVSEGKGQAFAVEVVKRLIQRGVNISLLIVGANKSQESNKIRDLIIGCENIQMVDFVDDVSKYYLNADVALVCSRAEAYGRVTIEAMKYGLPVIASNVGGNLELVKDNITGLLYQYASMDSLAEKILNMTNRDFCDKMAKQAYEWAWETMTIDNYRIQLISALNVKK